MTRTRSLIGAGLLAALAACVLPAAADVPATPPAAALSLQEVYAGVQVYMDQGRVRNIYGAPMTPGVTPGAAAAQWVRDHGAALGGGQPDLREVWSAQLQDGRGTVFAYQQFMEGLPVEHGIARIMVLHHPINRVVYAAGTLSPPPAAPFPPIVFTGELAQAGVRQAKAYARLGVWSKPELVVYQGEGEWTPPVRAWKFVGEDPRPETRERWEFFVNAATGQLIYVRNGIQHDVTVNLTARATPGTRPDVATNQPTIQPLANLRVSVGSLGSAFTDANGTFTLPGSLGAPTPVTADIGEGGPWGIVQNMAGTGATVNYSQNWSTSPIAFTMNSTPSELTTSQINGHIHTHKIHDFYRSRSGTWGLIDNPIPVNVNLNQTCNAFFDGSSINFFRSGGGCVNTAYSSVIAHEYGHYMVNRLGLGQGGFGEGFADTGALLLYNDQIIGREFDLLGQLSRDPYTANIRYPCTNGTTAGLCPSQEIHCCGQILGAVWWGIKIKFDTAYGTTAGLARAQQLFVDWSLITVGGTGPNFINSAHPGTAVEVLTVNDDDGTFQTATPDWTDICSAFSRQQITCPTGPRIWFKLLTPIPQRVDPNTPVVVDIKVIPISGTPVNNTGRVTYRFNGGSWTTVNMTTTAANTYRTNIPGQACGTNIEYYFTATAAAQPPTFPTAADFTYPMRAPTDFFWTGSANSLTTVFSDDFETDLGWSAVAPGDNATTGRWTRNISQATAAQPAGNHTANGFRCWVTDYRAGQQVSDYDVDDGRTTLTTPVLNLSNLVSPRFGFWLWYSNRVGPVNPGTNTFDIDITNDGGITWQTVRRMGPNDERTLGGWRYYEFRVDQFVAPTNNVRIRFIASDYTDSIVEAAIDDFLVYDMTCAPPPCYANCDGSVVPPVLNVLDFTCFLNRFSAGDPYANCDGSTAPPVLNVLDFTCFLNRFAAGCP